MSTRETIQAVRSSLSTARMGTYEAEAGTTSDDDPRALELYAWNALVSGALLMPLHIAEVVMRNAVSDALHAIYGANWPWSASFERSLPDPKAGYSPRRDLQVARKGLVSTGKVIAELKFVFWQKMFTDRFDQDIWNAHLTRVLPNLNPSRTVTQLRQEIYASLEDIRRLRNRIAHHEPVFTRNLSYDLEQMASLVGFRSKLTADWMMSNQQASRLIAVRP